MAGHTIDTVKRDYFVSLPTSSIERRSPFDCLLNYDKIQRILTFTVTNNNMSLDLLDIMISAPYSGRNTFVKISLIIYFHFLLVIQLIKRQCRFAQAKP